MRLTTFASGSSGNCALVCSGGTALLLDAGISFRRIKSALARCGLGMEKLAGVLVTHEHSDHVNGLRTLLKYAPILLYVPRTVAYHLTNTLPEAEDYVRVIPVGEPFPVGKLTITAFHTPHDTDESVGYRIEGPEGVLGFCTDTGSVTEEMLSGLRGCDTALIEANHDLEMLQSGFYPPTLKRRILSPHGHLSNSDCGVLACTLAESGTGSIVLGHLSRENNTPRKAFEVVRTALDRGGFDAVTLDVAPADGDFTVEVTPCCTSR